MAPLIPELNVASAETHCRRAGRPLIAQRPPEPTRLQHTRVSANAKGEEPLAPIPSHCSRRYEQPL